MFGKRSDQPRTAEDRARAAAERAARRSGKSPLPQSAFEDTIRPPDVEPHEPLTPEPEHEPAAVSASEWEPAAPEPQAPAIEEEPPVEDGSNNGHVDDQHTMEYTPFQTEEHEVPEITVTRNVETVEHEVVEEEPPEPPPPPPPPPRRAPAPALPANRQPRKRPAPNAPRRRPPKLPREPRKGGWGRRIGLLFALVLVVALAYAIYETIQPFHGKGSGTVAVTIPSGAKAGDIGELLHKKGVVDSKFFFEVDATLRGERGDIRPGHYTLKKGMTNAAALSIITAVPKGKAPVKTDTVTLVEGPGRKENAPVIAKSGKISGSYLAASGSKAVLERIRKLGAPKGTKTAEGFLFPATYTLPVGAPASQLVSEQLDAFQENFRHVNMSYARSKHLTRYDVLIIASMIEREAQLPRERALVSAVIYNRLKQGMPLSIDATTRYYTNNWQTPILESQLQAHNAYNTRLNRGLPPTPIGNPGLASLKAAAKPAHKSYLYYVRKPGKSGAHAFSSTDAQFERDVAKYQASRGK